jgi:transcriptional regulator GlxA family with amidase domain
MAECNAGGGRTAAGVRGDARIGEAAPIRLAVLVFPGFPLMAFSSLIEPLRAVNTVTGRTVYEWFVVGCERATVRASNGIEISPTFTVRNAPFAELIAVCTGGDADRLPAEPPLKWIRNCLRKGGSVGSVADGAFVLARLGLLEGYECTLHWTSQAAFAEAFPTLVLKRRLYVIDRTRFTSAGGIGAFDMMLEIIGKHCGEATANQVAQWFVHDRVRAYADREKLQLRVRTGIRDDLVLAAAALMEERLETSLSLSRLAGELGVTIGKLERSFLAEMGMRPSNFVRQMRMQRAHDLLEHSNLSVREIGLACGYSSFSSFIRAFRELYRKTPRQARREHAA